ncbi:hypothetical protein NA57DRAFT_42231, partial [Rhizodiscina lignyota]
LDQLSDKEQGKLLDLIDELRFLGVGDHIELPQIVVVGDQSSGKSSVLEAISGVKFPTADLLCTTFATEVILRRSDMPSASVAIIAHDDRSVSDKERFDEFKQDSVDLEELPSIIDSAKEQMALSSQSGPAIFFRDVLRLTVYRPDGPTLSMVDLPGIIHAQTGGQTAEDIQTVSQLVQSYMRNSRSIILAVIPASNDAATQVILTWAREIDEKGERTLGVITKPDLTYDGSDAQKEILALAKNQKAPLIFTLGWHMLRNRDYNTRNCPSTERDHIEHKFFDKAPWSDLPHGHVGIISLRERLRKILHKKICESLGGVIADIQAEIIKSDSEVKILGTARSAMAEKRMYLMQIAESFPLIVRAGVSGTCDHPFFDQDTERDSIFTSLEVTRPGLRAKIKELELAFVNVMERFGHTCDSGVCELNNRKLLPIDRYQKKVTFQMSRKIISDKEMDKVVQASIEATGGCELPGDYNPLAIGHLFRRQSVHWEQIAEAFVKIVWEACRGFLDDVINSIADRACAAAILREHVNPAMQGKLAALLVKLEEILKPHKSSVAITFNPSYEWRREQKMVTLWCDTYRYEEPTSVLDRVLCNMWQYYEVGDFRVTPY